MMLRQHMTAASAFVRREAMAVAALLGLFLLAGAFIEIADGVAEGETEALDRAVLTSLRVRAGPNDPLGPDWLTTAAVDVTALGSIMILTFVVLVVGGLFLSLGHRRQAAILVLASAGGLAWSQSLKALFSRTRPEEVYRIVEATNASFPSGHTMLSAAIYLTLGSLAASFARKRRIRAFCLTTALVATLLVGFSRIYLGVHWASDVIAGWCLGAAWALACWLALWLWDRRWRRDQVKARAAATVDADTP